MAYLEQAECPHNILTASTIFLETSLSLSFSATHQTSSPPTDLPRTKVVDKLPRPQGSCKAIDTVSNQSPNFNAQLRVPLTLSTTILYLVDSKSTSSRLSSPLTSYLTFIRGHDAQRSQGLLP